MFSVKYYDVSIGSYVWLTKLIFEYDLWTVNSPYGVVIYKDVFMVVKKKNLKIVDAEETEVLMSDAQKSIKEVADMINIFVDINKLASIYPPIKYQIKEILYHKVVEKGMKLKEHTE